MEILLTILLIVSVAFNIILINANANLYRQKLQEDRIVNWLMSEVTNKS